MQNATISSDHLQRWAPAPVRLSVLPRADIASEAIDEFPPVVLVSPTDRLATEWSSREAHPAWPGWKWQALHDPLTGSANRRLIDERLRQGLRRAARSGLPLAVLFADLDSFREINGAHGHCVGDHVLRTVNERLLEQTRASDTVGRFGGDEFVVIMEDAPGRFVWATAERMRAAIAAPIAIPAHLGSETSVSVTVSIGLARSCHGHSEHLLQRSDAAMYGAKHDGGNRVALAGPSRRWKD